nr:DUF4846 domain-containing protein [Hymenobacter translucens]
MTSRFPPPPGCVRVSQAEGSFGQWLRGLPLLPAGTAVRLHNGKLKTPQTVHAAVLDIDTGPRDLQQCADAVIRLRAEYQFSHNPDQVHFQLTSGHDIRYADWYRGNGFVVQGEEVVAQARPVEQPTHASFRRYLDQIFTYAGTRSLARELKPVALAQVQPGDVFIHGGSPGHAVMVLDVARHTTSGQQYILLAQSYMPAQNIHVLRNPDTRSLGAWFKVKLPDNGFATPEWHFLPGELGRFQ